MARTVFANSRNFSHKGSGDKSLNSAPDVCKTPIGSATPPIPYGIVSQASDLAKHTKTVFIDGNPTAIESSTHTKCSGDQPGVAKGIASGTTGDKTQFVTFSFDVLCEGEGVVRHLDSTTMNNVNTGGSLLGVSDLPAELPDNGTVEVIFQRKPHKRHCRWWAREKQLGYDDHLYDFEHTAGSDSGDLDSLGSVMAFELSPGTCTFTPVDFYLEIEDWIKEQLTS